MKIFNLLAYLLLSLPVLGYAQATSASGAPVTISWGAVAADTTGAAMTIGGYNVYANTTAAALASMSTTVNGGVVVKAPITSVSFPEIISVGNVTSWTTPPLNAGTSVWAITAWYCPATGVCSESGLSAVVTVTVTNPVPAIPGGVKVQCSATSSAGITVSCAI